MDSFEDDVCFEFQPPPPLPPLNALLNGEHENWMNKKLKVIFAMNPRKMEMENVKF